MSLSEQVERLYRDIGNVIDVAQRRTRFDAPHEEHDHREMLRTLNDWRSRLADVLALLRAQSETPKGVKPTRGNIGAWNDAIGDGIRRRLYEVIIEPPAPLNGVRYGVMSEAQSALFEELQDIIYDAMQADRSAVPETPPRRVYLFDGPADPFTKSKEAAMAHAVPETPAPDLHLALQEIARLRLATDEGSLRVRADRMWEIATKALAASPGVRHETVIDSFGVDRTALMTDAEAAQWLAVIDTDGYRTSVKAAVAYAINRLAGVRPTNPEIQHAIDQAIATAIGDGAPQDAIHAAREAVKELLQLAVPTSPSVMPSLVDLYLADELRRYLDTVVITGETIGDIRRSCFVPWDSRWNGIVRDETAQRERSSRVAGDQPLPETERS